MEQKNFTYNKEDYSYYLIHEERKTIRMTVYPNLKVVVYCPNNYTQEKIDMFLKRKALWMKKQIRELKWLQRSWQEKEYTSGESFIYLGRQYKLEVILSDEDRVRFESGKIILHTTDHVKNEEILSAWYEQRAQKVFQERYRAMLRKFDYDFQPDLAIRKMKKRWWSFLAKKKILLNPELIKASKDCIDYVIIHELCHMKYLNHSQAYWKYLASKCPDWKKRKEKLELRFATD